MHESTIRCPVCSKVFDVISHMGEEPDRQSIAMLAGPERVRHAEESPECTKHERWVKGWDIYTSYSV